MRYFSALVGIITVILTYVFISKWFSPKVAAFTSFLFSISFFHVSTSRIILPEIMMPLVLLSVFIVLTEAYRRKNIWLFGLGGFLSGLGLYTSPAFVVIPFLFISSGFYFFLRNEKFILAYTQELIVGVIAYFSAAVPFLISFIYHPGEYLSRFAFSFNPLRYAINLADITSMLFLNTKLNFFVNLGSEPLLDPFVFITSLFGFAVALSAIKRRKYFFLVIWATIFFTYAALKTEPSIIDLLGLATVIFVFSALLLDFIIEKWFKTFPLNKKAQLALIFVLSVFFALSSLYNFDKYFVAYKNTPEVTKEFSARSPIPYK